MAQHFQPWVNLSQPAEKNDQSATTSLAERFIKQEKVDMDQQQQKLQTLPVGVERGHIRPLEQLYAQQADFPTFPTSAGFGPATIAAAKQAATGPIHQQVAAHVAGGGVGESGEFSQQMQQMVESNIG